MRQLKKEKCNGIQDQSHKVPRWECVCINTNVFNGLSDDMKKAVTEAAVESATLQNELWMAREEASRKKVEAGGVKTNEISDKGPFQAAMKPVYDTYLSANPALKPLVELIQATD